MLSERSMLLACGGGFNTIEKEFRASGANLVVGPSTTAAAAAAFFYLEKVKKDKLSPNIVKATEASLSCEVQLNSFKGASMESGTTTNNKNSNNNQNNDNNGKSILINHVRNAHSGPEISPSMSRMGNHQENRQYQHQQLLSISQQPQSIPKQPQQSKLSCTANVKKERLSPSTNGDLQTTVSRSRSTTPSSFRGTSPQQISTETLMPLASLLRIQQPTSTDHQNSSIISATMDTAGLGSATAADYSSRNYSDIMRSLAAKYNDSNPTNPAPSRRNPFFDTPSTQTISAANKNINQSVNRSTVTTTSAVPSAKTNSQSNMIPQLSMSPGEVAVAAAAASFLSSLPFSQNVCPPLIDMSSTQALVTLARAAKEAEIHAVLRSSQQNPKPLNSSPISPHPSLSSALQQAAQFVSPALIYSAQLQHQQEKMKTSNQSSPMYKEKTSSNNASTSDNKSTSTARTTTATTPLDLSSQPPSKRLKTESNDTGSTRLDGSNLYLNTAKAVNSLSLQISESGSRSNTPEKTRNIRLGESNIIRQCQAQCEEVAEWSVDDVCAFVGEIDICAEYVQHFRDQCIDGSGLPLLTEDHLLKSLGMKLGPALKLRSLLAKKLGGPCPCVACFSQTRQMVTFQAAGKDGTIIPDAALSAERATMSERTVIDEESSNTIIICNKAKEKNYQRPELEQKQKDTEAQQTNNSDNSNRGAALTLQICANIYKNETNNNKHIKENLNDENKRSLAVISNNSLACVKDPTVNFTSEDCKNITTTGNSNSAKNGNLPRTESGDIADVGS